MRQKRIKALKRVMARNLLRIDKCCGLTDFNQICDECQKCLDTLDWAVYTVTYRLRKRKDSESFKWIQLFRDDYGTFAFEMVDSETKEKVNVIILGSAISALQSAKKGKIGQ